MVHYSKVINGIVDYIDHDMIQKMHGSWKAWGIGTVVALIAKRGPETFSMLRDNQVVQMTGLIDGEMIDVDSIYVELLKQAQKSSATIDIPIIGSVTYNASDVEEVYRRIVE